ncbi:small nuclear ribonucleoprotein SmD3b-like [Coffea eugenioides]|uniref:small nuclear ribonucleoprotein SmD3b-like n=1 Tax=Coffea eugenioides TaxID=49369 RepID=UPI000F61368D|nr:small nuclear ribonucleoprotein SmD3b-like [Coffea eugenioides]
MSRSLGIPVKLLHEATGHIVTVELKSGELYRGSMVECEDNWNCQLKNITFTAKVSDARLRFYNKLSVFCTHALEFTECRTTWGWGCKELFDLFMVIPDMLKNALMFKRLEARIKDKGSALGVGWGRAVAMRARVRSIS